MRTLEAIRKDVELFNSLSDSESDQDENKFGDLGMALTEELLPFLNLVAKTGLICISVNKDRTIALEHRKDTYSIPIQSFARNEHGSLILFGSIEDFDMYHELDVQDVEEDANEGDTKPFHPGFLRLLEETARINARIEKAFKKDRMPPDALLAEWHAMAKTVTEPASQLVELLNDAGLINITVWNETGAIKKKYSYVEFSPSDIYSSDVTIHFDCKDVPEGSMNVLGPDGIPNIGLKGTRHEFEAVLYQMALGEKGKFPAWRAKNLQDIEAKWNVHLAKIKAREDSSNENMN